ncbi:MAG: TRAP transporter small permease [Cyclobacteriaceae bacterium]
MRNKIDMVLGNVLAFIMALMVINVLWQVISRYLLGSPSIFTDELATFMLIWVGLLGAAYATGQGKHLAIDILPNKLDDKSRAKLNMFIYLIMVSFALLIMVVGGSRLVYLTLSLEQLSATLRIPLGYIYLALPISGLLIMYYAIDNLLTQLKNGDH